MKIYYKDLLEHYNKPFLVYDYNNKSYRNIRVVKLLSIADSPERRSSNYIKLENVTYSARWGYALNVYPKYKTLISCQNCMTKMILQKTLPPLDSCSKCTNYNFNIQSQVSDDYPKNVLHNSELCEIGSTLLTY